MSSFPITPASSLIDPRTLSLEPNTYPPSPKDGKKGSKKTTGQDSEAAIGRKLSQPFPNGYGEVSHQLHSLPEETLLDEGFAEGSTIERSGNSNNAESNSSPKVMKASSYVNVDLPNDKMFITLSNRSLTEAPQHQPTVNSYENFTPKQLRKSTPTRYENSSTTNSSLHNSNFYSAKIKQQHSQGQSKVGLRPQYENFLPKALENQQNGTLQKQRIVSDVHLALSSPQQKAIPSVTQPIAKTRFVDFDQENSTILASVSGV